MPCLRPGSSLFTTPSLMASITPLRPDARVAQAAALLPQPTIEAQQAVRLRRFVMASASYLAGIPLLFLAYKLGFVELAPALAIIAVVVAINSCLYILFRSGMNLRFADPSLTWPQIIAATTMVMVSAYTLDADRGAALVLCPVLLTFGMFRFTTRQMLAASGLVLTGYGVMVLLLLAFKPERVDLAAEGFRIAVLACVLPCFALAGGKISEMRTRLRKSNE